MNRLRTIMMIVCALVLLTSTLWSAQTTNLTGQVFQRTFDMTRYAAGGLAGDAVMIYDVSAHKFELSDTWGGAGANIEDGTATGQNTYWDNGVSQWRHNEVTEMFWDDTNKGLGIGNNVTTYLANPYNGFLVVSDALTTTTTNYGIYTRLNKIAGVTDGSDDLIAAHYYAEMADADSTIGNVVGIEGYAYVAACTAATLVMGIDSEALVNDGVSYVYGIKNNAQMDAGTCINIEGIHNTVVAGSATNDCAGIFTNMTQPGGSTIGDDWFGIYQNSVPTSVTGSIWGVQNTVNSTGGATAIFGQQNNITKTSDNLSGNFTGTQTLVTNTAGDVTGYMLNTDMINIQTAGTVGSLYGGYIYNDQNGGTVTGSSYGLYINQDFDGTTTGATYDIYINEATGVDYGYFQVGTAPNQFGGGITTNGNLTTAGNTIYTPGTITLASGDNDAATATTGTALTVTGPGAAFKIGGITTGGVAGRMIKVVNLTGFNCTIEDDEIAAAGCIVTMTGADVTSTGNCSFELVYLGSIGAGGDNGWAVVNFQD